MCQLFHKSWSLYYTWKRCLSLWHDWGVVCRWSIPSTPANEFWPGIGKPSNPQLCSMTGYTTFHCIVMGSGRYTRTSDGVFVDEFQTKKYYLMDLSNNNWKVRIKWWSILQQVLKYSYLRLSYVLFCLLICQLRHDITSYRPAPKATAVAHTALFTWLQHNQLFLSATWQIPVKQFLETSIMYLQYAEQIQARHWVHFCVSIN